MSVILLLILVRLIVALTFLGAFVWAVRSGQYEDTQTPSMRVLMDEERAAASPAHPGVRPDAAREVSVPQDRDSGRESALPSNEIGADSRPLLQG